MILCLQLRYLGMIPPMRPYDLPVQPAKGHTYRDKRILVRQDVDLFDACPARINATQPYINSLLPLGKIRLGPIPSLLVGLTNSITQRLDTLVHCIKELERDIQVLYKV